MLAVDVMCLSVFLLSRGFTTKPYYGQVPCTDVLEADREEVISLWSD